MKTKLFITLLLGFCLIGCAGMKPGGKVKVRDDLAKMIEDVAGEANDMDDSFESIQIDEYSYTHLIIGRINDIDVCSKDVEKLVSILQDLFEKHPSIDRNVGPHIVAFLDDEGDRYSSPPDPDQLRTVCEMPGIYVSVPK